MAKSMEKAEAKASAEAEGFRQRIATFRRPPPAIRHANRPSPGPFSRSKSSSARAPS